MHKKIMSMVALYIQYEVVEVEKMDVAETRTLPFMTWTLQQSKFFLSPVCFYSSAACPGNSRKLDSIQELVRFTICPAQAVETSIYTV